MIFGRSRKAIGDDAENKACDYLKKHRLKILERNFRSRNGEIDIIASDKQSIIFIEVKFRQNNSHGEPFESVTALKQQKIIKTALYYLQTHPKYNEMNCRFDVISIYQNNIQWLKNAFEAN
ncbi:MAG: YraN family protein [Gammaproteobacteria bacterium]|nr:YraN family protein [Gammaproteobacteria bacterium]